MIIMKVTYTVKPPFISQNKKNIRAFLYELHAMNPPDIRYFATTGKEENTFVHLSFFENEEAQEKFMELRSFRFFQQERDASGLLKEPEIEELSLVGASHELFSLQNKKSESHE